MGRLRDGLSHEQANAALPQHLARRARGHDEPPTNRADRRATYLARTDLRSSLGGRDSRASGGQFGEPLRMLFALVGLLFAVACASAANLLLARGVARRREIAVRLAIGASRARVVRQLFTESLVSTAIAAAVGRAAARRGLGNGLVAMMTPRASPRSCSTLTPNWRSVLFALRADADHWRSSVRCFRRCARRGSRRVRLLRGTGPAAAHAPPPLVARTARWSSLRWRSRWCSLVGAALFVRSLTSVLSQDAGFDRENVLVVATDAEVAGYEGERLRAYYAQLARAARGHTRRRIDQPRDDAADQQRGRQLDAEHRRRRRADGAGIVALRVLQCGLARLFPDAGHARRARPRFRQRRYGRRAPGSSSSTSRSRAGSFPNGDPLGRRISIGRSERRRNLRDRRRRAGHEVPDAAGTRAPHRLSPGGSAWRRTESLRGGAARSGEIAAIADRVDTEVRALDARVPVRIETVSDRIRESLVRERVMAVLASSLGVTALALACAALYGLLAYAVSRQAKEIGLRLALGRHARRACCGRAARLPDRRRRRHHDRRRRVTGPRPLRARAALPGQPADAISLAVAAADAGRRRPAGLLPARRAATIDPAVALHGGDLSTASGLPDSARERPRPGAPVTVGQSG